MAHHSNQELAESARVIATDFIQREREAEIARTTGARLLADTIGPSFKAVAEALESKLRSLDPPILPPLQVGHANESLVLYQGANKASITVKVRGDGLHVRREYAHAPADVDVRDVQGFNGTQWRDEVAAFVRQALMNLPLH